MRRQSGKARSDAASGPTRVRNGARCCLYRDMTPLQLVVKMLSANATPIFRRRPPALGKAHDAAHRSGLPRRTRRGTVYGPLCPNPEMRERGRWIEGLSAFVIWATLCFQAAADPEVREGERLRFSRERENETVIRWIAQYRRCNRTRFCHDCRRGRGRYPLRAIRVAGKEWRPPTGERLLTRRSTLMRDAGHSPRSRCPLTR